MVEIEVSRAFEALALGIHDIAIVGELPYLDPTSWSLIERSEWKVSFTTYISSAGRRHISTRFITACSSSRG